MKHISDHAGEKVRGISILEGENKYPASGWTGGPVKSEASSLEP